jgi:multiple sugar transport system ATP-binding protein
VRVPRIAHEVCNPNLTLGIRPEHVALDEHSPLRARVTAREYLGTLQIVYLAIGSEARPLRARLRSDLEFRVGDQVGVVLDPARISLFDAQGSALSTTRPPEDTRSG